MSDASTGLSSPTVPMSRLSASTAAGSPSWFPRRLQTRSAGSGGKISWTTSGQPARLGQASLLLQAGTGRNGGDNERVGDRAGRSRPPACSKGLAVMPRVQPELSVVRGPIAAAIPSTPNPSTRRGVTDVYLRPLLDDSKLIITYVIARSRSQRRLHLPAKHSRRCRRVRGHRDVDRRQDLPYGPTGNWARGDPADPGDPRDVRPRVRQRRGPRR